MANTYKKIQTVTVGAGGASSIDFTSIPQTYTDLKIVVSSRSNRSGEPVGDFGIRFNGDSAANYSMRALSSNGTTASSNAASGQTSVIFMLQNGPTSTASVFSNGEIYIPYYTSGTQKSCGIDNVTEHDGTTIYTRLVAGLWTGTAAITQVTLLDNNSATIQQYSTATLYGIFKENVSGAPSAPTSVVGTDLVTSGEVSVVFTPAGQTASLYTVTSSPGSITATGTASPITVSGLTNNTSYTLTVTATNPLGSATSAASSAVTPTAFSFPANGALFSAGYGTSGVSSVISYVDIATTGNSLSWGSLTFATGAAYYGGTGCASSTRGIHIQGYAASATLYNGIQYSTFSTKGNGTTFGNSTDYKSFAATCSSSTRGVTMGGTNSANGAAGGVSTGLEYITIATTGNATSFGSSVYPTDGLGGCASTTRGLFGGRTTTVYGRSIDIDYITIATTGNTTTFGNLNAAMTYTTSASSSTRGFFAGGGNSGNLANIDYVTIASTGNATNFGNLTLARGYAASVAGTTRGLTAGGYATTGNSFVIDYITIASTGNATSFGNLLSSGGAQRPAGMSNSHGGI